MRRKFKEDFVRAGGEHKSGRLVIDVPNLARAPVSVEIRDRNLRLLGRAQTGKMLTLPEGEYAVSVLLPDGQRNVSMIKVPAGGESQRVTIDWRPRPPGKAHLLKTLRKRKPSRRAARKILLSEGTQTGIGIKEGWFTRFVTFRDGRWVLAPEVPSLNVMRCESTEGVTETEIEIRARRNGVFFMEVRKSGGQTTSVVLPMAPHTEVTACRVTVTDGDDILAVSSALAGSSFTELVGEYVETGALQEAADVMVDAEKLLNAKISNPIAAALGGYALLRLGDLERLHNWPENLAKWMKWLPDGAVIAGELAAKKGRHPQALEYLLQAVGRGLPIFSEGLSISSSRLRQYALYGKKLLPEDNAGRQALTALQKLQAWSQGVDYSAQLLTLTEASLLQEDPETAPRIPSSSRGWRGFRPRPGPVSDQQGYWVTEY